MLKLYYKTPQTELLQEVPSYAILDASLEGSIESYGEEQDFTW